jgi:hypothetical protein
MFRQQSAIFREFLDPSELREIQINMELYRIMWLRGPCVGVSVQSVVLPSLVLSSRLLRMILHGTTIKLPQLQLLKYLYILIRASACLPSSFLVRSFNVSVWITPDLTVGTGNLAQVSCYVG